MEGQEADHNNSTLALRGGYGYHSVKWGQNSRFVPIYDFGLSSFLPNTNSVT